MKVYYDCVSVLAAGGGSPRPYAYKRFDALKVKTTDSVLREWADILKVKSRAKF